MREVKTGLSSTKEVIIEKGLKINEYITLTIPPKKEIKSRIFFPKEDIKDKSKKSETDSTHHTTQ